MNQLLLALALCSAEFGDRRPCCDPPGMLDGEFGGMGVTLIHRNDPCYRGTIFNALKIVRAYRDNQAFAFHHFEDKRLQVSGRLVKVRKDTVFYVEVDPVTKKARRDADGLYLTTAKEVDVFTALITPDGKPPLPELLPDGTIKPSFGLEFRFPLSQLRDKPDIRCALAALWAGQFVTLKGDCRGAVTEGDYTAIIFENAEIVP
jgi:hypothetical protein